MGFIARGLVCLFLLVVGAMSLLAAEGHTYHCATSADVHAALEQAGPGDTILLEGGRVYEIEDSLKLRSSGTPDSRIRFTSHDDTGQNRYAVITTVDRRKEESMVALMVTGSYWTISRLEISGERVPLDEGYWDTNGFRLGIFLQGRGSHNNIVEDVHIHDTHNAAVAVRDESHDNIFRGMRIHHIGEWLDKDYNAHEAEGFYLGSSKGIAEAGDRARAHGILIEGNVLGPGLLGQYVDIKYGASAVTVRNNSFYCDEKSYNEEVVKVAGFDNVIEHNEFIGSSDNLTRYIHIFSKKTDDPVLVNYQGQENVPAPTGRDNKIANNVFYTDDPDILAVRNDVAGEKRASIVVEGNRIKPFDQATSNNQGH
jgi:hypothetical protein